MIAKLLSILLIIQSKSLALTFDENTPFEHSAELWPNFYSIKWNYTSTQVYLRLEAKYANGWIAFGLSPNGGYDFSETIIAWKNSNRAYIRQMYTGNKGLDQEIKDNVASDWTLDFHMEDRTNTKTILIVHRNIKVCNISKSIPFSPTNYVVFAWGQVFNDNNEPVYRTNSGTKIIPFLSLLNGKPNLSAENLITIDNSIQTSLSTNVSTFYCSMFRLGNSFSEKRHLVKYDFNIQENQKQFIFSIKVYGCSTGAVKQNRLSPVSENSCTDGTWRSVVDNCKNLVAVYLDGGQQSITLPDDVGFPVGPNSFEYLYAEYHLRNSAGSIGNVANVGVNLHFTSNLRAHEYGILSVGLARSPTGILLPPLLSNLKIYGIVRSSFLDQFSSFKVFGSQSNGHLGVIRTDLKQIRNDQVINDFASNTYYGVTSQYLNFHPKVEINKGDGIVYSCTFSTLSRQLPINSGITLDNEKCEHFLYYYDSDYSQMTWETEIPIEEWRDFFLLLNNTGAITWVGWNGGYETMFQSALTAVFQSNMLQNPVSSELVLQNFYTSAKKIRSINGGMYGEPMNDRFSDDGDCQNTPVIQTTTTITTTSDVLKINSSFLILICMNLLALISV